MVRADCFTDEVETTVSSRTCQGAVETGKLTRTELAICARCELVIMPIEGLGLFVKRSSSGTYNFTYMVRDVRIFDLFV